jgi:hypothetical protein
LESVCATRGANVLRGGEEKKIHLSAIDRRASQYFAGLIGLKGKRSSFSIEL